MTPSGFVQDKAHDGIHASPEGLAQYVEHGIDGSIRIAVQVPPHPALGPISKTQLRTRPHRRQAVPGRQGDHRGGEHAPWHHAGDGHPAEGRRRGGARGGRRAPAETGRAAGLHQRLAHLLRGPQGGAGAVPSQAPDASGGARRKGSGLRAGTASGLAGRRNLHRGGSAQPCAPAGSRATGAPSGPQCGLHAIASPCCKLQTLPGRETCDRRYRDLGNWSGRPDLQIWMNIKDEEAIR